MASVQKRVRNSGTTTYVVRWYAPDGTERTRGGFGSRKAAEAYAIKQDDAKLRGVTFDPNDGKVLFRDAALAWLASRPDLKETTRAAYRDALAPTGDTTAKRHKRLADLRIDAVFGGYPINAITRDDIRKWIARMQAAGKKPSTIRNAYFLVRQVLGSAVADGALLANPADYVKLPTEHNTGNGARAVDDLSLFLTAVQVSALVAATPWPYNVMVQVAALSGLRALTGLQVGDVILPKPGLNPNAPAKPAVLRVERTVAWVGGELTHLAPKTTGTRRRVPLPDAPTAALRDYLAVHPRRDEPTAPLFPAMRLRAPRPTGVPTLPADGVATNGGAGSAALRQATALADLTVAEAEARLALDWDAPLRHAAFYKAVFRPAVLRANRLTPTAALPPQLKFHALRHTYASLCIAAGRPPIEIARFMGHAKVTTTLGVTRTCSLMTTSMRWRRSVQLRPDRSTARMLCRCGVKRATQSLWRGARCCAW